jgi:hypothetical protein
MMHRSNEELSVFWLPASRFYDLPEKYSRELDRFLDAGIISLSSDYRKPDSTYYEYWKKVVDLVSEPDGLWLEMGVFTGTSISIIGNIVSKNSDSGIQVHGFDCWSGLPEKWRDLDAGSFDVREKPKVPENITLVDGLFSDSLPSFLNRNKKTPVSFLHLDADLYSSTMTAFEHLHHRFVAGTIIAFDEFALWPGFFGNKESEFEALTEASEIYGFKYDYIFRGWDSDDSSVIKFKKKAPKINLEIIEENGYTFSENDNTAKYSAREKAVIRITEVTNV